MSRLVLALWVVVLVLAAIALYVWLRDRGVINL